MFVAVTLCPAPLGNLLHAHNPTSPEKAAVTPVLHENPFCALDPTLSQASCLVEVFNSNLFSVKSIIFVRIETSGPHVNGPTPGGVI